ncbi:MAG: Gldg family protein, partial [Candidatus Zixiibacteriota bacterium]
MSHIIVLLFLGRPDLGLMISNYIGCWLIGSSLLSVGMLASLLTENATIAFILGAIFSSIFVFFSSAGIIFGSGMERILSPLGVNAAFNDFARGVVSLSGIIYFVSITGLMLYLNVVILGRRHWPLAAGGHKYWVHQLARSVSLIIAIISLNVILTRASVRLDATAEGLHSLANETEELINELPADQPVLIQAYISPDVPTLYVETRANILSILDEVSSISGGKIQMLIHDTEPFSDAARDAREKFGITAREVTSTESARASTSQIFLGLAFTSGVAEDVIAFFDKGLPVEYEIIRSIRVVARTGRKKVGILTTPAKVFGGMDFQTMASAPPWSIVTELEKQYEVVNVSAGSAISEDIHALLVVLPSALTQTEMNNLKDYIVAGHPTLILEDPMPAFNLALAPLLPSDAQRNPFMQNQPAPEPKGDVNGFYKEIGVSFNPAMIVWDNHNPYPELTQLPPEIVFISATNRTTEAFNPLSNASKGLQELVLIYGGVLNKGLDSKLDFQSLLQTGRVSSVLPFQQLVQRGFFGMGLTINRNVRHVPDGNTYT